MNKSGFTLIGILVVIMIIAALGYGGSFFLNKNSKNNKTIQQNVDRQLDEIQRQNTERNKLNSQALDSIKETATTTD